MVSLLELVYASIESCRTDWPAANDEVVDEPTEVKVPSVDVPDQNELASSLEKDAGWTQSVGFVNPHFFEA